MVWAVRSLHPQLFDRIFVKSEAQLFKYWAHAKRLFWFDAHPGRRRVLEGPAQTLLLRLRGDDAPINKATS
eukprot:9348984-Lingulodinium_polyedra.AAC.1